MPRSGRKQASPQWYGRHAIPGKFYQYVFDNFYYQGYTPQLLAGYNVNNEVQFAGVWDNTGISGTDMKPDRHFDQQLYEKE